MYYKLVSRDNVESDILDAWPPILDPNFTLYNNSIVDITFPTEAQIFTWLESVSRLRISNKQTNSQSSRNGDPNKIYAVYLLKPVNATQIGPTRAADTLPVTVPVYMYSVKMIRPGDPQLIIVSDTGERIKSSFKKYNVQKYCLTDRLNPNVENAILHSSEFRKVNQKYFEGIYPIGQELGIEQPQTHSNAQPNAHPNTPADRDTLSADYMGGDTSSMISGSEINPDIFETRDIKHLVRGVKQSIQQNGIRTYDPYNTQNINHVDINPVYADYMEFVSAINTLDVEHHKFVVQHGIQAEQNNQLDQRNPNTTDLIDVGSDYGIDYREYDVVFADKSDKWLDNFITKLEKVEAYLRLLATGGKGRFNIRYSVSKLAGAGQGQHEMRRSSLIIEINRILETNSDMTYETSEDFKKISNFVADPLLFDGDVYQVRFEDTLLIWHASYSQIIKEIRIVPSARFCKYIAQFDLSDFFKQNQSIDILNKIYENLAAMYRSDKDQYNRNNPYGGSGENIDYRGYGYQNNPNNPNSMAVPIRVVKKEPALRKVSRTF